jgi:hypothetical protein
MRMTETVTASVGWPASHPRRQEFNPMTVHVGFILDKAAVRQVYIPFFQLSLPILIPRMFQSLIYHHGLAQWTQLLHDCQGTQ